MKKIIICSLDKHNQEYVWSFKEDQFGNKWFSFQKIINNDYSKAVVFNEIEIKEKNNIIKQFSKKIDYYIKEIN